MAMRLWKNSRNPDEIMDIIKDLEGVSKFTVLDYFGTEKINLQMLQKLLNSGYYTPEEIAERGWEHYIHWTHEPALDILLNFANLAWQKLEDPSRIAEVSVGIVPDKRKLFIIKLKYFKDNNPSIYHKLLSTNECREFLQDELDMMLTANPKKYKKQIFRLLTSYPEALDGFDVFKCKKLFSEEEYKQIIEQRQRNWKYETNAELIMYNATEENRWEILEYFAQKDEGIFNSIVNGFSGVAKKPIKKVYPLIDIVENYADADLESLPKCLKEFIIMARKGLQLKKEEKDRKKLEKDLSWKDANGEPLELFKLGHISPSSREDYEKILKKFLEEELSIVAFCSKYGIRDYNGFRKMLDKFAIENPEYKEQIESKSNSQQSNYITTAVKLIKGVCMGGKSVETIIKHSRSYSLEKIQDLAQSLFPHTVFCEVLTVKIIEYYYDRLNSHTSDIDYKNISNMLTIDEIRFILGAERMRGRKYKIEEIFKDRVLFIKDFNPYILGKLVISNAPNSILRNLSKYNGGFTKTAYFKDKTLMLDANGNRVEVTEQMVDMALQYAYANDMPIREFVINVLIRGVVKGIIQNEQQTQQEMADMRAQAKSLIYEIVDIDEYFEAMDKLMPNQ